MDTLYQVLTEEPLRPGRLRPRLPRDLERVCLKCLERDPNRRYATALALADDLRRHLNGEAVAARPAGLPERLWRWSRRNPVAASLLLALTLGSGFGFWHLSRLTQALVRSAARESAAQQSEMLDEYNKYYSRVVGHLEPAGVTISPEWEKDPRAAPLPATVTIELGQQLAARRDGEVQVRLYSDYPFRGREHQGGGARDAFEREALRRLRQDPGQPFYSFEEYEGRSVIRYATARVMGPECLHCHNTHPDSPRHDWEEGDVRGALEVIRPLDRDEARIRRGLRGTLLLGGAVTAALLGLCLLLLLGRRRRLPSPLASGGGPQAG